MPGYHSAKEKRQAKHVAESERKRGMSAEDAESVGWATVNKNKHAKKADSLAHVQGQLATAQSVVKPSGGAKPKTPRSFAHVQHQLSTATSVKAVIPDRDTGRGAPSMMMSKKKGKLKKELPSGEAYPAMGKADDASSAPAPSSDKPRMTTLRDLSPQRAKETRALRGKISPSIHSKNTYQIFRVGKADDASSPVAVAPAAMPKPARVRGDKPTVKIKPISNAEAAANLRSGAWRHEKSFRVISLDEAAAVARDRSPQLLLKATGVEPPPAHWKPRWHPPEMTSHYAVHGPLGNPKTKYKTKKRAQRAMDKLDLKYGRTGHQIYAVPHETKKAGPPPVPGTAGRSAPGKPYLPGVHAPSDPQRPKLGIGKPKIKKAAPPPVPGSAARAAPGKPYLPGVHAPSDPARPKLGIAKPAKKSYPTMVASEDAADKLQKPGTTASLMSAVKDSDMKKRKVAKSQELGHTSTATPTGAPMDPNNLNDLFKSELDAGPAGDGAGKVLVHCPQCDHPITKAEVIAKARGAGHEAHIEGEGSKATADAHVAKQNGADGGPTRTKGKGMVEPARTGEGAMAAGHPVGEKRAADKVGGVQNSKGSGTKKAMGEESSSDEESTSKAQPAPQMSGIRGTPWVQWVDSGEDARIAKAISEGTLGEQPLQPLDKHNRRG